MADVHRDGLTKSLSGILQSSKYSDMTIRCGSEEFQVHKALVCPRSQFFAAACDGQFKEAETSTIVLEEDDLPTVCRMLTYLYTLDYDDEGAPASAQHYMVNGTNMANSQTQATMTTPLSDKELLRHTKMMNNVAVCAIAQKYDTGELKELATAKFRELLWLEAPNHGLPDIIGAVFETTSTTDPGLRDIAVGYCVRYSNNIVVDNHLSIIIKDYGELGLAVLREVDQHANEDRLQKELLHAELVQQKKKKELLHKQLVTLKGELAQMLEGNFYGSAAIGAHVEKLNAAYNNILI